MSLVTTITLTIGVAIAKQMAAEWLGEGAQTQITHDCFDLFRDRINEALGKDADGAQIERLAAQAVRDMTPLWAHDARTLNEESRAAIVLAVGEALASRRLDADLLIQKRLDADQLARLLDERRPRTAGFSQDERTVYERLLRESCRHLVAAAHYVYGYGPLVDRHMLLTLDEVLLNLERLMAGPSEAERRYETRYRETLPEHVGRFDQIGIRYAEDATTRQRVDNAYIGLRLETDERYDYALAEATEARLAAGSARPARDERPTMRSGSIHDMLAMAPRLVVRGQPGSGKSTLLRWLAVCSSRGALGQEHTGLTSLDGAVPFYLRLRAFKEGDFPNPLQWPKLNAPALALEPPPEWMDRLLRDGRALVLIDGVDEVSLQHRRQLLEELETLVRAYPTARYVITTRPAAIKHWPEWATWMRSAGFVTATLQEMEPEQVFAFVDQWHDALLTSTNDATERAAIRSLPVSLKQLLRQRLPLRQLARNPLLCTMICALHRDRPQSMPRDRATLYADCIALLLYRRDSERGVGSMADYPALTYRHEEAVLRDYAHHMLFNEESEESFEEMESFFDGLLARYQMPGWTGTLLRDFFLKRTGLLIEPAEERIAFAHRSFQEFLTARAIVNRDDIGLLLSKARDDQWRETILLTVAIPEINEKQSEKFFRRLLKKADALTTPRNRHELFLLAVACTESPMFLSDELKNAILDRARTLIPPRSDDDVQLLAKAGDPIVRLLHYDPRMSFRKMARCVGALAEIGSEAALRTIAEYAHSPAYSVPEAYELRRAVGAAMGRFDEADYFRRVLGSLQTLYLSNTQVSDAGLAQLAGLGSLQRLDLSNTQVSDAGLAQLAGLGSLQRLDLSNTQVSDAGLAHLAGLGSLQTLDLRETQVSDAGLAHLAGLGSLQTLDLSSTQVSDAGLVHLAGLGSLQTLDLSSTQVSDAGLAHLAGLGSLQTLDLSSTQVSDAGLAHLAGLGSLQTLDLSSTQVSDAGLAHLAGLGSLQRLVLSSTQVSDAGLAHLAGLGSLQTIYLINTQVSDAGLAHLAGLGSLQWLTLWKTQVSDAGLAHLAGLGSLQSLDLSSTQVSDAGLAHLAGLGSLQTLDLRETQVSDAGLAHLAGLGSLQTLDLSRTQVSDAGLAHLAGLGSLQTLVLMNTQVSDAGLAHLAGLGSLQTLVLINTQVSDAGLAHLAGLGSLQALYLMNTQVSDAGLAHLAGLGSLQELYLSSTQVSDAGLAHLAGLGSLQTLDLRQTQVRDASVLDQLLGLDVEL
jgi:Leucine-rich repeat (LRR) protein